MKTLLKLVSWIGPRRCLSVFRLKFKGNPIFYADTDEKVCFLSIDDAPGPDLQNGFKVLDILKKHDVQATFFVISDRITSSHTDFMNCLLRSGHELGNHMEKNEPVAAYSPQQFEESLKKCEDAISLFEPEFSKRRNKLFRPPYGKISRCMPQILEKNKYGIIMADLYSFDYRIEDADFHVKYISKNVSQGSVIVLHFPEKEKNLQTLEILSFYHYHYFFSKFF